MVEFSTGEKVVTCFDIPLNGCGALVSDKYEFPFHVTEHFHGLFAHVFLYFHVSVIIANWCPAIVRNPVFTNAEDTTTLMGKPMVDVLNDCISILLILSKIVFCFWFVYNSLFFYCLNFSWRSVSVSRFEVSLMAWFSGMAGCDGSKKLFFIRMILFIGYLLFVV